MMKKLICLFVVLALAGFASAATTKWIGTTGNWEDSSNWSSGVPTSSLTVQSYRSDTTASVITINTTGAASGAITLNDGTAAANATLILSANTALASNGTALLYSTVAGSSTTVTVNSGAVWSIDGSNNKLNFGAGSTAGAGTATMNLYGTLNVLSNSSALTNQLIFNNVNLTTTTSTLDIYSTGILNTDYYKIGAHGTARIYIADGGVMWIAGQPSNLSGDLNSKILRSGGGSLLSGYDASYVLGVNTGATWVSFQQPVPEPATMALLGLGGLLFFRKKH